MRGEYFQPSKGDKEAWYAWNLRRMRNSRARRANFTDRMRMMWLLTTPEGAQVFKSRAEIDRRMREAIRAGVDNWGKRRTA